MLKKTKHKIFIYAVFAAVLLATLIAELFSGGSEVFGLQGKSFFHAWYGFISCAFFILFAKVMGFLLKRKAES